jgi:hypothetical protein
VRHRGAARKIHLQDKGEGPEPFPVGVHPSVAAVLCWQYAQLLAVFPNREHEMKSWAAKGSSLFKVALPGSPSRVPSSHVSVLQKGFRESSSHVSCSGSPPSPPESAWDHFLVPLAEIPGLTVENLSVALIYFAGRAKGSLGLVSSFLQCQPVMCKSCVSFAGVGHSRLVFVWLRRHMLVKELPLKIYLGVWTL